MKRKNGQQQTSKRKKSSDAAAPDAVVIREGPGFTQLSLPPGQGVVVSGCAALEVVSGCVRVFGALVTPDHGRVRLTAPARHGRALLISAVPAEAQAPLAQPTVPVQAVLHTISPAAAAASADAGAVSFSVVDASSADAPSTWQAPQQWMQAAEAVVEAAAAAAAAAAPLVVAVTGCKGCGKSAAARLLANSLISSSSSSSGGVVYMDLDPGQPELTPVGLLSLHMLQQPLFGPSHMQQQEPLLAFFQGDVSSQSEPGRFLQAVQALCSRYYSMAAAAAAAQQPPPPLVVNTPGWITGLGLELLAEALRCAGPSYVVDIRSPNSKKNLPDGCWRMDAAAASAATGAAAVPAVLPVASVAAAAAAAAETPAKAAAAGSCYSTQSGDTATTANLSSSSKSGKAMSAADARALSWLAWARRVIAAATAAQQQQQQVSDQRSNLPGQSNAAVDATAADGEEFQKAAVGLAGALPYEVRLQDVAVELQHAQVQQCELPLALNGALVGLASSRNSSSSCPASTGGGQEQQGIAGLGPQLQECLGVGLVRGVDAARGLLYLLTDLDEQRLQDVDVLLVGRLELPEKLSATQQLAPPYQSLFCLGSAATGAGLIKSRNNLLRAAMLRQ